MVLSILICTTRERKTYCDMLLAILGPQLQDQDQVEVLIDKSDNHIGMKRNELLRDAHGTYSWFIDDSDWVSETAIKDVLSCAQTGCDVMGISGMTSSQGSGYDWVVRLNSGRIPDVNTPMKTELAKSVRFSQSNKCDKKWAGELYARKLLKTESIIEKPLYHKRIELKIAK